MKLPAHSKSRGFTLIELLVVISIISLLSSVVFSSIDSARSKARNSKRSQEIIQLATAFTLAYDSVGSYPAPSDWTCVSVSCYGGWAIWGANQSVDNFFLPYISSKPTDPAGGTRCCGGYIYYHAWGGGSGYEGYFPAGVYIDWLEEPPLSSNSCGAGRVWSVVAGEYVQCLLKLD